MCHILGTSTEVIVEGEENDRRESDNYVGVLKWDFNSPSTDVDWMVEHVRKIKLQSVMGDTSLWTFLSKRCKTEVGKFLFLNSGIKC